MASKGTIDMQALGKRLKLARVVRDLTLQQLSALSGVGVGQISRLENGEKPGVRVDTLAALATPLEVSLDHLVGREEPVSAGKRSVPAPTKRARTRTTATRG